VQWQDAYPQDSLAAWYSGHQQHNWDVTFAGGDTRRRIFTHHPGKNGAEGAEHGYWTGDMFCNCSSHFQAGTAVLSMYDIHESEPYQWIHAYLPRSLFEEVVYQGTSIYVRYKHVYAMVRFAHPYHWVEEGPWADIEVICDGAQNGAVCEVGTALTHGSFMSFISEMEKNNMKLDENNMWLIYDSKRNGHIRLTRADRFIDGKSVAFNYDTYDSPYMHAGWDEGVVRIQFGGKTLVCDFKHMAMTIAEHK
jgi:hypothetical protein